MNPARTIQARRLREAAQAREVRAVRFALAAERVSARRVRLVGLGLAAAGLVSGLAGLAARVAG